MTHDMMLRVFDNHVFGEFGDINPSITDSSTFTFMSANLMEEMFDHEIEGCFLYSRHWNPVNRNLAQALALMEGTEAGQVTASGMSAISCTLLQLCQQGDEIVSSRTVYGGTYALLKHMMPRFGINVKFVNITDLEAVKEAISPKTKAIYCESMSNPLLEMADLPAISEIAKKNGCALVVDNTFTPLIMSPAKYGADVVIHSLTKYINGASDCVAGAVCASKDFIHQLMDITGGTSMLLGPVLDSYRSASIWKNLHTLHIRMRQHSHNAQYLAENLAEMGLKVHYPGLAKHPYHAKMSEMMNEGFGYGGMVVLDVGNEETAMKLMNHWQEAKVGLLAVSLGYFRTLFSAPGSSTSSEIPEDEQAKMGLSKGMIRMSVGLDNSIETSLERMRLVLKEEGLI